jgi:hypothetical protein
MTVCRAFSSFLIYRRCVDHLTLCRTSPFGDCAALLYPLCTTQTKNSFTGAFEDVPKFGLLVDLLKFFVGSLEGASFKMKRKVEHEVVS